MEPTHRSSFHLAQPQAQGIHLQLLQQECNRLLNAKQALDISPHQPLYTHLPLPLQLIHTYYHSLVTKFEQSIQVGQETSISHNLSTHNIKYPLFKILLSTLQKKLFFSGGQQKFHEEASYSLAFKPSLTPYFLSMVSQNSNFVPLQRLSGFYRALTSDQYPLYLPIQLYFLFGGNLFTIESKTFKQKIVALIDNVARTLSHSETFISRNIQYYKNNKERKLILDESIKAVMLAKNKQTLIETADNITRNLFGGKEYLNKQEFLHQLQSRPLDPTLTIFLLLLRSEFILIQEKNYQHHLTSRTQASNTNFYAHEMTKLFNKCPFNGDERCNCKKCQCVRRNRESAKLNQQKKRNAVEAVEHMKGRIDELQQRQKQFSRKMGQLQQQNMMLKALLNQIKRNHTMKSSMLQTIEPISKVLNNQL